MDKKEILMRSQLENKKSGDERERLVFSISGMMSYIGMMVIVTILIAANRLIANYIGVDDIINPNILSLLMWVGSVTYFLTMYWYTRKILVLFASIAFIIPLVMDAYQVFRIFADAVSGV